MWRVRITPPIPREDACQDAKRCDEMTRLIGRDGSLGQLSGPYPDGELGRCGGQLSQHRGGGGRLIFFHA